jgi:hypothetical protein
MQLRITSRKLVHMIRIVPLNCEVKGVSFNYDVVLYNFFCKPHVGGDKRSGVRPSGPEWKRDRQQKTSHKKDHEEWLKRPGTD